MAMAEVAVAQMSESEHQACLRRAVIASTVGTTIEWYDFLMYSTVTGLVFAKVYFPGQDPLVGTLQAFGVFFIGFVARPIIAGGPAPFISTWLFATYHSTIPIGIYITVCAVISIAATMLLPDYTNKDIALEAQYGNV